METVDRKHTINKIALYTVIALSFLIMFLMGGYGVTRDSEAFLSLNIYREPLYSLLATGFKALFGADRFCFYLAMFQNALAMLSTIILVRKFDELVWKDELSIWLCGIICIVPYLMTPIFSRTHLVISNMVMQEALTMPLYYFFMSAVLGIIYDERARRRYILMSMIICLLLVLTRGQMNIIIIGHGILLFAVFMLKKDIKGIMMSAAVVVILFLMASLTVKTYNLLTSGVFRSSTSGNSTFLSNVIYVSEHKDGDGIEDGDLKLLFDKLYKALDENELLYDYAGDSPIEKAEYYEKCHDTINFDYFEPIKNEVYDNRMGTTYTDYLIYQDEIAGSLIKELLPNCLDRWTVNYLCACMLGFIRTVAINHKLLRIYTAIIYFVYAGAVCIGIKKYGLSNNLVFALFVLMMIVGFTCGTTLFIMCISRYVIYNLPFFYISLYMMIKDIFLSKQDKIGQNQ